MNSLYSLALVSICVTCFISVATVNVAEARTIPIYTLEGGLESGWRDVSWNGLYDIHYRAHMNEVNSYMEPVPTETETETEPTEYAESDYSYSEGNARMADAYPDVEYNNVDFRDPREASDMYNSNPEAQYEYVDQESDYGEQDYYQYNETNYEYMENDYPYEYEEPSRPVDTYPYQMYSELHAIYASPMGFGGLSLHAPSPLNASSISFYINIIPGGDPTTLLLRLDTDKSGFRAQAGLPLDQNARTGEWQLVVMPLSKLGSEPWDRITIQDTSGNGSTFFVTDLCIDVGDEAQTFNPFQTYLPPMWPLKYDYAFHPGQDLFETNMPVSLYQNGAFGSGVSTWSWGGEFNYTAPSPTGYAWVTSAELRKGGGVSITTEASFETMNSIVFWIFLENYASLNVRLEGKFSPFFDFYILLLLSECQIDTD